MSKTIGEKLNDGNAALTSLLTYANGVTGAADTNLGDAVKTLADGFGGSIIPAEIGLSKIWMGTITIEESTATPVITHNLGEIPKVFLMWLDDVWDGSSAPLNNGECIGVIALNPSKSTVTNGLTTAGKFFNNNGLIGLKIRNTYDGRINVGDSTVIIAPASTTIFPAGAKYNIIAMA